MRLLTLITGILGCATLFLIAQQKPADPDKILQMEKQWTEAYRRRDVGILSSLLAEDFIITVEDGSTYGKMGYISHSASSAVQVEVAEMSELKVRMHGNAAVVTGAYHEKGSSNGAPYEYRDRLTDVWMKNGTSWQVIASHYSVPVNP